MDAIYTVTLNPTLDITYTIEEFVFGQPVKASQMVKCPGGKGINVSLALHAMGTESVAVALIGGHTGEEVRETLREMGLNFQFIKIENETRTNVIVLSRRDGRELIIRSAGPGVREKETEEVRALISRVARPPGFLVLSGSLPPGIKDDIYASLVAYGKSQGMKTALDADGDALRKGIQACPHLIKPNVEELSRLAGRSLSGVEEILDYARELVKGGVDTVAVSMGGEGGLLVNKYGAWLGEVEKVPREETVGAGDSMLAGLITAMIQGKSTQEILFMGLAYGVSAVLNTGPGLCEPKTYAKARQMVKVRRLL